MDLLIVLLFAGVVVIGLVMITIMGLGRKKSKLLDRVAYQKAWDDIEGSLTDDNKTYQFAIIQADKLLDKALKEGNYAGTTMAERMTSASRVFSQRESVWTAHKLRNRIAHEHTAKINPMWAKKALQSFKRALKDVGAL